MLTGSSRIEPAHDIQACLFRVLKVALVIYTLFLPDSPLAGVAQDSDSHTGDAAANAAQEAGILPASLRRDAFSS